MTLAQSDDEGLRDLTPQSFIGSALFEKTFEEGMALVDETAKYLDGRGASGSARPAAQDRHALCRREHAGDDAADAGGELAPGAARRA